MVMNFLSQDLIGKKIVLKDQNGNILCRFTNCGTPQCPFEAASAHGSETAFLSGRERLLATQPPGQPAA